MDFLLEPLELGSEFEELLETGLGRVSCDTGYVCSSGTIEPDQQSG